MRRLDEEGPVGALQLSDAELLPRGHVEEAHLDGHLRVEDGVVGHGPLLREGQRARLRGLGEGLAELEGHVLGTKGRRSGVFRSLLAEFT